MRWGFSAILAVMLGAAAVGCSSSLSGPNWFNPGPVRYQQNQALLRPLSRRHARPGGRWRPSTRLRPATRAGTPASTTGQCCARRCRPATWIAAGSRALSANALCRHRSFSRCRRRLAR